MHFPQKTSDFKDCVEGHLHPKTGSNWMHIQLGSEAKAHNFTSQTDGPVVWWCDSPCTKNAHKGFLCSAQGADTAAVVRTFAFTGRHTDHARFQSATTADLKATFPKKVWCVGCCVLNDKIPIRSKRPRPPDCRQKTQAKELAHCTKCRFNGNHSKHPPPPGMPVHSRSVSCHERHGQHKSKSQSQSQTPNPRCCPVLICTDKLKALDTVLECGPFGKTVRRNLVLELTWLLVPKENNEVSAPFH